MHDKILVLFGAKGSGKTHYARLLEKEGFRAIDTDEIIRSMCGGKTAREAYRSLGEIRFREIEAKALKEAFSQCLGFKGRCVISTGGGIADNKAAVDFLASKKSCLIPVFLRLGENRLVLNAFKDGTPAYLSAPDTEAFLCIARRRNEFYSNFCDYVVDLEGLADEAEIENRLLSL